MGWLTAVSCGLAAPKPAEEPAPAPAPAKPVEEEVKAPAADAAGKRLLAGSWLACQVGKARAAARLVNRPDV